MTVNKKHIFIGIAILLIFGGGIVFVKEGIMRVLDDKPDKHNFQCREYWRCLDYDTDYNVTNNDGIIATNLFVEYHFRTDGEFAVDNKIDYIIDIDAKNESDVVKDIEIMIAFTDKNYTGITKKDFLDVKKNAIDHHYWISLDRLNATHFYHKSFFTIPVEDKISFIGFVIGNDGRVQILQKSEKLLDIKSHTKYVDAKQALELETYNRIFLGLAWMGIGIPFILIGADMLLRIYLRENQIKRWYPNDQFDFYGSHLKRR